MAPVLKENFADLRKIHGASARAWEARVQEQSSILVNYYESLAGEEMRLQYLLNLLIEYQSAPARLGWRAARERARGNDDLAKKLEASVPDEQADQLKRLKESDSVFGLMDFGGLDGAAKIEARQQQLMNLLNTQRKEIAVLEVNYELATTELNRVRETRATGDRILDKAGEAIDAWQKAHRSLQAAARGQQSRPSVAELQSTTKEIASFLK